MNFLPSRHGVGEESAWFAAGGEIDFGGLLVARWNRAGARHGVCRG